MEFEIWKLYETLINEYFGKGEKEMEENDANQPVKTAAVQNETAFRLSTQEWIVIVLIAFSIIGVGVTDFAPAASHWYWLTMVPFFGAACIFIEWQRAKEKGLTPGSIIRNQVFIWIGLIIAVQLVYLLLHAGRLDNENTGLIILLLLSLTVFGSGIYLGWRLCLIGACLALALVMATYLEEFVWLFMIVLAVGAVAYYFSIKFRSSKTGGRVE
jgi:hypothetical protein